MLVPMTPKKYMYILAAYIDLPMITNDNDNDNDNTNNVYNTDDTSWWRNQMETFSAVLAISVENSPVKWILYCCRAICQLSRYIITF